MLSSFFFCSAFNSVFKIAQQWTMWITTLASVITEIPSPDTLGLSYSPSILIHSIPSQFSNLEYLPKLNRNTCPHQSKERCAEDSECNSSSQCSAPNVLIAKGLLTVYQTPRYVFLSFWRCCPHFFLFSLQNCLAMNRVDYNSCFSYHRNSEPWLSWPVIFPLDDRFLIWNSHSANGVQG